MPELEFESPGHEDRPVAMYEAGGTLVLATMNQEEHPGSATLWRSASGRWQKLGTLQHAVPRHMERDSDGTFLSPGPGARDIIATYLADERVGFSRDGGATWSYLARPPRACAEEDCFIGAYGDYVYVAGSDHLTTLVRAAFGTTTWEEVSLPPSRDPHSGYRGPFVLDDGTLIIPESDCNASGAYRISRDHGDSWSERRELPGSSTCMNGTTGNATYASDDDYMQQYRSTDLVHWEPVLVDGYYPPRDSAACPRPRWDPDPFYHWVVEQPVRVGDEVFTLGHLSNRDGREHVLMVSRDDCRTWHKATQ